MIRLLGAATLSGPFYLVVEYCENGSLKNYLRMVRTMEPIYMNGSTQFYAEHSAELLSFTQQISRGMQYLSEIKVSQMWEQAVGSQNKIELSLYTVFVCDFAAGTS